MAALTKNIRTTLEMIKIEHTLFALPFAFLGAVLAAGGVPTAWQLVWITVAMVGARSTAMAFNRIADKDYDASNPRTKSRAIPAGVFRAAAAISAAFSLAPSGMKSRCRRIINVLARVGKSRV